jgi:hypothetical protein
MNRIYDELCSEMTLPMKVSYRGFMVGMPLAVCLNGAFVDFRFGVYLSHKGGGA